VNLTLYTRCLPFLTSLYHIFYVNGVKIVPDSIYELSTPVALAHWIMGEGTWEGSGVVLSTDSYTIQDVVRLINVLIIRYGLDCTLRTHQGKPRIYIRSRSMPQLLSIVLPHMCPSMSYKLGCNILLKH
jgi:hypothetical protein